MKHKHADLIHAWADGAEIETKSKRSGMWVRCIPEWHEDMEYRIKDPYAELKAAAKDPTKEICIFGNWIAGGKHNFDWNMPVDHYGIRDKPKPKVKMWQWVCRRPEGTVYLTQYFYHDGPDVCKSTPLFRADWTEIEIDE